MKATSSAHFPASINFGDTDYPSATRISEGLKAFPYEDYRQILIEANSHTRDREVFHDSPAEDSRDNN
jgi:hypothetical protein